MIKIDTKKLHHAEHSNFLYYTITDHLNNLIYISDESPIDINYMEFDTSYDDDSGNLFDIPTDIFLKNYINIYSITQSETNLAGTFVFHSIQSDNSHNNELILKSNGISYIFCKLSRNHKKSYSINDLLDINNIVSKDIFDTLTDIEMLKKNINNHTYHSLYKYIYLDDLQFPDYPKAAIKGGLKNENSLLLDDNYDLNTPTNTQLHQHHNALLKKRKQMLIKINEHLRNLLQLKPLQTPDSVASLISSLNEEELTKFNCNITNYLLYLKIISQILNVPLFYKNHKFVIKFKSFMSYGILSKADTGEKLKIIPFYINKDKNILNIQNFLIGYNWIFNYNFYLYNFFF